MDTSDQYALVFHILVAIVAAVIMIINMAYIRTNALHRRVYVGLTSARELQTMYHWVCSVGAFVVIVARAIAIYGSFWDDGEGNNDIQRRAKVSYVAYTSCHNLLLLLGFWAMCQVVWTVYGPAYTRQTSSARKTQKILRTFEYVLLGIAIACVVLSEVLSVVKNRRLWSLLAMCPIIVFYTIVTLLLWKVFRKLRAKLEQSYTASETPNEDKSVAVNSSYAPPRVAQPSPTSHSPHGKDRMLTGSAESYHSVPMEELPEHRGNQQPVVDTILDALLIQGGGAGLLESDRAELQFMYQNYLREQGKPQPARVSISESESALPTDTEEPRVEVSVPPSALNTRKKRRKKKKAWTTFVAPSVVSLVSPDATAGRQFSLLVGTTEVKESALGRGASSDERRGAGHPKPPADGEKSPPPPPPRPPQFTASNGDAGNPQRTNSLLSASLAPEPDSVPSESNRSCRRLSVQHSNQDLINRVATDGRQPQNRGGWSSFKAYTRGQESVESVPSMLSQSQDSHYNLVMNHAPIHPSDLPGRSNGVPEISTDEEIVIPNMNVVGRGSAWQKIVRQQDSRVLRDRLQLTDKERLEMARRTMQFYHFLVGSTILLVIIVVCMTTLVIKYSTRAERDKAFFYPDIFNVTETEVGLVALELLTFGFLTWCFRVRIFCREGAVQRQRQRMRKLAKKDRQRSRPSIREYSSYQQSSFRHPQSVGDRSPSPSRPLFATGTAPVGNVSAFIEPRILADRNVSSPKDQAPPLTSSMIEDSEGNQSDGFTVKNDSGMYSGTDKALRTSLL